MPTIEEEELDYVDAWNPINDVDEGVEDETLMYSGLGWNIPATFPLELKRKMEEARVRMAKRRRTKQKMKRMKRRKLRRATVHRGIYPYIYPDDDNSGAIFM